MDIIDYWKTDFVFLFSFWKSKWEKKIKIPHLKLSQPKWKCIFATQWRVPACTGLYGSYNCISWVMPWSLFCLLLLPQLHCLNGGLKVLWEDTLQTVLQTALRHWGVHSAISMGVAVACDGLFMLLNCEILHFKMIGYIESYLSHLKMFLSLLFLRWLFGRASFFWQKPMFCIEKNVISYQKMHGKGVFCF